MALPTSYLTSTKNLEAILNALQGAKAPPRFTQGFLESLGFKGTADRLVVPVLRALGFLGANNEPTDRYYEFLDQTQAPQVLAEGIEEAYADLFAVNTKAFQMSRSELEEQAENAYPRPTLRLRVRQNGYDLRSACQTRGLLDSEDIGGPSSLLNPICLGACSAEAGPSPVINQ